MPRINSFQWLTLGCTLSSIGSTFTGLAIYTQLADSPDLEMGYGITFALGILPGTLAAELAVRLAHRTGLQWLFLASELILLASLQALLKDPQSRSAMFAAISSGAAAGGLLVPLLQTLLKRSFPDGELERGVRWSAFLFGLQFLIGNVLGALLLVSLGVETFIRIDILTSLVSALTIAVLWRRHPDLFRAVEDEGQGGPLRMLDLDLTQWRAFLIYPALALICAPAMIMAPMKAAEFKTPMTIAGLPVIPYLMFFLARGLGQVTGPYVQRHLPKRILNHGATIPALLIFYLISYAVMFRVQHPWGCLPWILLAHVASNVVYVLSQTVLARGFPERSIGWISARSFQASSVLMALEGALVGWIKPVIGYHFVLVASLLVLGAFSFLLHRLVPAGKSEVIHA